MKTKTSHITNSMNRSSRACGTVPGVLLTLMLVCFALSPQARATCQEGCLTNQNTVLGDDALFSLTTGTDNTAIGFDALFSNTDGINNTAIGSAALFTIKEQASQIQKVKAQFATATPSRGGLETTERAPQIALNNQ